MPPHIWPRERCEYLAAIWRSGYSFSELAGMISEAFGIPLTRSAIAGKVSRMNLRAMERIKREPKLRAPRQLSAAATKPAPVARKRVPCEPRMIDILELKADTCRFPYGDLPPFRYCGCPILKGSPYCSTHTAVCWNHPPLEL
jgi:GcrA cell cycle regulator